MLNLALNAMHICGIRELRRRTCRAERRAEQSRAAAKKQSTPSPLSRSPAQFVADLLAVPWRNELKPVNFGRLAYAHPPRSPSPGVLAMGREGEDHPRVAEVISHLPLPPIHAGQSRWRATSANVANMYAFGTVAW